MKHATLAMQSANVFLQRQFQRNPNPMTAAKIAADWTGEPEALSTAAAALRVVVTQDATGAQVWALPSEIMTGLREQAKFMTTAPAVPARSAAVQPTAPAYVAPSKPAAATPPPRKESAMPEYSGKELRTRVTRLFGSHLSHGAEKLALHLVTADQTVDQAMATLAASRGTTYSGAHKIDTTAIYARRAEECHAKATGPQSSREAAPPTGSTDPNEMASSIYERRARESQHVR